MSSSTLRTTPSGELDLSQIDFDWVTSCKNVRDLQRVVDALEHEPYPQLLEQAKNKLFQLNPKLAPPSFQPASRDEVQTAIRELDEWIDSTKAKDALFSAAKNQVTPSPIRPIRGSTDTFSSTTTTTSSCTSANPSITAEQHRISSQREKEKGNECYKSREYVDAITSYTKAMNLLSEDITLYTNRAMAYFKLKRYDEMIQDCNTAITRDNNNFKAYWRRGMGHGAQLRWKEAIQDYTRALELSPGHAEITKLLKEARSHESDPPAPAPSTSTQFKRMTITEVDDDDDDDDGDEEKEQKQKSEADTAPLTASQKKNARKRAKKKAANAATTATQPATPAEPMKRLQVVEDDDEDDEDDNADDVESVPINVKKAEPTPAEPVTTALTAAASQSIPVSTNTPAAAPVSPSTISTSLTPSIPVLTAFEESQLTSALATAEAHKARGNSLYSSGSHELAIEAYTAAIKALPTETTGIYAQRAVQSKISSAYATYHSNRAACRQQIGQHKEAIADCTVAIDITRPLHIASTASSPSTSSSTRVPAPNPALYIKSLLRRAFAYETIDSMAASLTDMEAVLAVDPSVVVAQQGKHRLSKSVNQERVYMMRDGKDNGNKHFGLGAWQAAIDAYTRGIQAYDQLTSQALSTSKEHLLTFTQLLTNRALSYIKLLSYEQARADCDRVLQQGTALDADVVMRAKAHYRRGLALVGLGDHRAAVNDLETANKLQPSDAITTELTKARAAAEKQPKSTTQTSKTTSSTTSKSKIQLVDQTPNTTPSESKSTTPATKSTSTSSSTPPSTTSSSPSPSLPPPPKSFFQWESAFRQLSSHPDIFHQYLLSIPPNTFSSLFKSTSDTLNADMCDKIVDVCDKYMKNSDASRVADLLQRMCGVHRFSLTRSMLSPETLVTLRRIIPALASEGVPQATVQNLKAKYGLE